MPRLISAIVIAAVAASSFVAGAAAQADEARLGVLQGSPDAPAVHVYLDGAAAISDVAARQAVDAQATPPAAATPPALPSSGGDPADSGARAFAWTIAASLAAAGLAFALTTSAWRRANGDGDRRR